MNGTRTCSVTDMPIKVNNNQWVTTLHEDSDTGELILQFPDELIEKMGWEIGDSLEWVEVDGAWTIQKKK